MKRKVAELLITPIGMEMVENMALYISAIQTFLDSKDPEEQKELVYISNTAIEKAAKAMKFLKLDVDDLLPEEK